MAVRFSAGSTLSFCYHDGIFVRLEEGTMAWVYQCTEDNVRLIADSKEQLAQKLMEHAMQNHQMNMTLQQAMDMVNKGAQQAA